MLASESPDGYEWKQWSYPDLQANSLALLDHHVQVLQHDIHRVIIEGKMQPSSDLTGHGNCAAVIVERGTYGEDTSGQSVTSLLKIPSNQKEFEAWAAQHSLRIVPQGQEKNAVTRNQIPKLRIFPESEAG